MERFSRGRLLTANPLRSDPYHHLKASRQSVVGSAKFQEILACRLTLDVAMPSEKQDEEDHARRERPASSAPEKRDDCSRCGLPKIGRGKGYCRARACREADREAALRQTLYISKKSLQPGAEVQELAREGHGRTRIAKPRGSRPRAKRGSAGVCNVRGPWPEEGSEAALRQAAREERQSAGVGNVRGPWPEEGSEAALRQAAREERQSAGVGNVRGPWPEEGSEAALRPAAREERQSAGVGNVRGRQRSGAEASRAGRAAERGSWQCPRAVARGRQRTGAGASRARRAAECGSWQRSRAVARRRQRSGCFLCLFVWCFVWTENLVFSRAGSLSKQSVFRKCFLPKILGREGGLDVWTIRWLRELFLLCQLVVKLGARAAMDIYGVHADELAHCVALRVIEMKIDEIIVRKCSRVLRLIMERTGRRAAMFPFAVVLAGMERALISPLPSEKAAETQPFP